SRPRYSSKAAWMTASRARASSGPASRICIRVFLAKPDLLEGIQSNEFACPPVVVEQSLGWPAEDVVGDVERFAGSQAVGGVSAALGDTRVGSVVAVQRARRDRFVGLHHLVGPVPAAVQKQDAAAGVFRG